MKLIMLGFQRIALRNVFLCAASFAFFLSIAGCTGDKTQGSVKADDQQKPDNNIIAENNQGEKTDAVSLKQISPYNILDRKDHAPMDSKANFIAWRKSVSIEDEQYIGWRWDCASEAIKRKEITNETVLEAFLRTPREDFCRSFNLKKAYADAAIVIGYGQTISGPHMVSKMTNELAPGPSDKVLEIGTGSGYQSAVFAQLSNFVYSIEIIEPLAKETDAIYKSLEKNYPEFKNVKRKVADGYFGWQEYAPFDRIAVTCGIDHIPPALIEQLAPHGIMLIPVGPPNGQTLLRVTKKFAPDGSMTIEREDVYKGRYYPVFVPFTSEGGKGKHTADEGQK
jgi:protein-L-isoaspartate(D-aspartate) O-methyltransferase